MVKKKRIQIYVVLFNEEREEICKWEIVSLQKSPKVRKDDFLFKI